MRLIEDDLQPRTVRLPKPHHIAGKSIWSIDGSSKILDYTAFYMLLSALLAEYEYSNEQKYLHHTIGLYDSSPYALLTGIFSVKNWHYSVRRQREYGTTRSFRIPIVNKPDEPIIVSYDPHSKDKKPSITLAGNKFMQTLEILANSSHKGQARGAY